MDAETPLNVAPAEVHGLSGQPAAASFAEAVAPVPAATTPGPSQTGNTGDTAANHALLKLGLFVMACIVFLVGVVLSVQTMHANRSAAAQIQGLYEQINGQQDHLVHR